MSVRKATLNDLDTLINFGKRIIEESPYINKFDQDGTREFLTNLIQNSESIFLFETDQAPVGMLVSALDSEWFSGKTIAYELCLYVLPAYRKSNFGKELVSSFVEWATLKNVDAIHAGTTTGINASEVASLYVDQGFTCTGFTFMKEG